MKNKITRNVNLDRGEVIQKEFKNLKVKDKTCSMLLTDKRLVIYTFGPEIVKGHRVRRQIMNEIDLRSIHRFEYFYEIKSPSIGLRVVGLLLFVLGLGLAYANLAGMVANYVPSFAQYWQYIYGVAAVLVFIGLSIVFASDRKLVLQIRSGLEEKTNLLFYPTKYNELALQFIAGRIHVR